ncbi:MAG: hypothetical protein ACLR8Y_02095 [Alistipes indistinctus]
MKKIAAFGCCGRDTSDWSELKKYYERKVAEGKNKMSVINALRAKIVARMFAVIRKKREI